MDFLAKDETFTGVPKDLFGVTLEGEKRYSQIVDTAFHISMAALEPTGESRQEVVSVMLQHDQNEFLLCSLQQGKLFQQPLDLNFIEGEELTFYLTGKGRVHLTGYLCADEEEEEAAGNLSGEWTESEADSSVDSDEEVPQLESTNDAHDDSSDDESPATGKRRKKQESGAAFKRTKQMLQAAASDSDDSDIDALLEGEEFDAEDWETDSGEGEEENEEEDMNGSFNEKNTPAKNNTPKPAIKKTPQSDKNNPEGASSKKKSKKKKKNKGENTPNAAGDASTQSSAQKKATSQGTPTSKKQRTPASDGKVKTASTPASGKKVSAADTPGSGKKSKKVHVKGGLFFEDIKEGHGPEAKSGQTVGVYYSGKLTNNKPFDSTTTGKPFKFKLGKSEVIKGWDMGIQGMKVGGKRKLTVPANLAYGKQRVGPIPPNSTLVFEVELKNVN